MAEAKTKPWLPWVIALALGAFAALLVTVLARPGDRRVDRSDDSLAGRSGRARMHGAPAPAAGSGVQGRAPAPEQPTPTSGVPVRVVGPLGSVPAAGATVLLDGDPVGVTDEKGELQIDFPVDHWAHAIFAERDDESSSILLLDVETLPPGAVVLPLRASTRVVGQVLDREGRPAAGVPLRLLPGVAAPRASDREGRFDFGPLGAGDLLLLAEADSGDRAEALLRLLPGQTREVVLLLEASGRLRGQVVDDAGRPLSGMTVDAEGERFRGQARSRSDGSFSLKIGGSGRLVLDAHGRGLAGRLEIARREGPVTVVARPAAALRVVLSWSDGEPVLGARVALHRDTDGPSSSGQEILSGGDPGHYRRDDLEPGPVTIFAAAGGAMLSEAVATITLVADEEARLEATLPAEGMRASIFGVVLEGGRGNGAPIEGARVLLVNSAIGVGENEDGRARIVLTDSKGHFRFDHLQGAAPGEKLEGPMAWRSRATPLPIRVEAEGFAPYLDLVEPDEAVTISLMPRRLVRGRVVDEAGLPLQVAWVARQELATTDGVFETELDREQSAIEVGAPGFAPRRLQTPPGPRVDLGTVTLSPADPVDLRVLTPDGQPAAGAVVLLLSNLEFRFHTESAPADRAGKIALIAPTWPVALEAHHPAFLPSKPGPLTLLEPGATITLRLQAGAFVTGSAGGAGRRVLASPLDADPSTRPRSRFDEDLLHLVRADAAGHYRMGPLAPGKWVIEVTQLLEGGDEARFVSPPLLLVAGQESRADFADMQPHDPPDPGEDGDDGSDPLR